MLTIGRGSIKDGNHVRIKRVHRYYYISLWNGLFVPITNPIVYEPTISRVPIIRTIDAKGAVRTVNYLIDHHVNVLRLHSFFPLPPSFNAPGVDGKTRDHREDVQVHSADQLLVIDRHRCVSVLGSPQH